MGKRRHARELALQVLFHLEFSQNDAAEVFELICENFDAPESIRAFSKKLVLGVCERRNELDSLIREASDNWRLERMPKLDRCILRIAAFELAFSKEVPPKVSIDEALEIGKKYGSENSCRFINGVLDNIYNKLLQKVELEEREK